ncbi:MAG: MATE family efflux transporter [Ruminococcus flavefaciens]|nr:MATE family efflux transporter [Ruminococcus flavefaciens]
MEKNLTTGSVFKNIVVFSLPYFLSYLLQTLYGMADLYIIGQFEGVASTTAVSIGSQVMHMLTVMIVGFAMGATVFIGQSIGGDDKKKAARGIGNTVTLFMVVSVVLTVILVALVKPITSVMSTPADAVPGTVNYLTICFIGIPFITAYNVISAVFRGMGDSKSPMYFIAVACAANIGLDYLFMGVFHIGPAGAALGTTLSQAISVIVSLAVILKRKMGVSVSKADFKPQHSVMGQILKIGIPVAFQDGLIQIAFIVITIIANHRGLNDSAAVGIVEKVMCFLFLIPSSMLSTVSALGAQNIGANKPKRAVATLRYAAMLAVGFGIVVAVTMQFIAEPVISLFTDAGTAEGAEVARLGGQYLRGYVWDCIFAGVHFCFSGYFCAVGKSGISFIHNLSAIIIMRIPGVYLTSKMFPTTLLPMGLATASGSLISVIICIIAFALLTRKSKTTVMEGV